MLLHKAMRELGVGDTITVLATDPSTERDITRFCEFLHHELLELKTNAGEFSYLIRKGKKTRQ